MKFTGNKFLLSIVAAIVCIVGVVTAFGDDETTLNGRAEITPTLMYAAATGSIEPLGEGIIIVGDLQSGNINAIIPSTFRINGTMIPTSVTKLPSYTGFTGEVYQLTYPIFDFIESYHPFYDSTLHGYTVTATCDLSMNFVFCGQVMMRGHSSGDVNSDNRVNISDLTYLVTFLFHNGPTPRDMDGADVNHNGSVTVGDVSALVRHLFAS